MHKESEKSELASWLREESPLVTFSRSLRCEGSTPGSSEDANKGGDKPVSLLEGIDLEELPDEVREALLERDKSFAILQADKTRLETEKQRVEELARNHQSRADRLHEVAKRHNLLEEPGRQQKQDDPHATLVQTYKERFIADGMKPEAAEAYAKMFAMSTQVTEQNLKQQLAGIVSPLIQTVGDLTADKLLAQASSGAHDPNGLFEIPEVAQEVNEHVANMVRTGSNVSLEIIQSLAKMAYGEYVLKNPDKPKAQSMKMATRQTYPGAGNAPKPPQYTRQQGEAPVAANSETAAAIAAVTGHFNRGLTPKKGGK